MLSSHPAREGQEPGTHRKCLPAGTETTQTSLSIRCSPCSQETGSGSWLNLKLTHSNIKSYRLMFLQNFVSTSVSQKHPTDHLPYLLLSSTNGRYQKGRKRCLPRARGQEPWGQHCLCTASGPCSHLPPLSQHCGHTEVREAALPLTSTANHQ